MPLMLVFLLWIARKLKIHWLSSRLRYYEDWYNRREGEEQENGGFGM